ncbi:hypothetical protein [Senimuribacter intestinalis]|nr:hypothetical protein [Senimuribacter intestinalis]
MKYYEFVNLLNRIPHEGWSRFDMAMFLVGYKGGINQKDIDNIQKYTN